MRDSMLANYCVFKQLNGMGYRPAICRCLVEGFGWQANDSAFIMVADCDDADRLWLHPASTRRRVAQLTETEFALRDMLVPTDRLM